MNVKIGPRLLGVEHPGTGKQSHLGETFYKSSMQSSHRKAQAKEELKKIRKHIDYNCD